MCEHRGDVTNVSTSTDACEIALEGGDGEADYRGGE